MGYNLKCSKTGDGDGYTLAYGKGKKKVTAEARKADGKNWSITSGLGGTIPPSVRLKDIKDAWLPLAEAEYEGRVALTTDQPAPPPPAPRRPAPPAPVVTQRAAGTPPPPPAVKRPGPPSISKPTPEPPFEPTSKQTISLCHTCGAPENGWHDGVPPCRCAFNNTDDYVPDPLDPKMVESGNLTALGALDIVFAWMLRNKEYVATNGVIDPVWSEVQMVLYRETQYPHHKAERFQ